MAPPAVNSHVARRLLQILNGEDESGRFLHLTPEDRANVLQILRETKPSLWEAP
jgi:hypothetical protein